MSHYTLANLNTQQETLSHQDYDLRVTNLARFIYRKIGKNSGRFIDIGAGNGLVLRFFKRKGFNVTGMELSQKLCDAMKQNVTMKGIAIIQGDISKKRGSQEYDYVLASDVIEHIENDQQAIGNLYSFVAPGGMLIITVPAHQFLYGIRDRTWGHYRRYGKRDLVRKFEKLKGGKVEFVTYWNIVGFFAYFFYEKILGKPIAEEFRYKTSLTSKAVRGFLSTLLRLEEIFGYSPIGLTLVIGIKKVRK